MRRLSLLLPLVGALLAPSVGHAAEITCAPYRDAARYYEGPDDRFLSIDAFSPKPDVLSAEAAPYVRRLVEALKARGTTLVTVIPPRPGFAFVGKLDAATINGTPFAAASAPAALPAIVDGHRRTLQAFSDVGANPVDLLTPMLNAVQTRPDALLFWKRDTHWAPDGASVAANAVADFVRARFPDVVSAWTPAAFDVVTERVLRQPSLSGWDWIISRTCRDHTPLLEPFPVLKLARTGGASEPQNLLGEEDQDVVLVGTSFTSAPPEFGFALYLAKALGHDVVNAAVQGGGAIAALTDYYLQWKPDGVEPKVLLWEFPPGYVTGPATDEGNLSPQNLRQLLPILAPTSESVKRSSARAASTVTFDVSSAGARGSSFFLDVTFDAYLTRSLRFTLVYDDGEETIEASRSRGTVLDRYLLELHPQRGALRSVRLSLPDAPKGAVTLDVRKTP